MASKSKMGLLSLCLRLFLFLCVFSCLEAQERKDLGLRKTSAAAAPDPLQKKREKRATTEIQDIMSHPVRDTYYCGDTDKLKVIYLSFLLN